MIKVAYFIQADGQVFSILTGPSLAGMPDAPAGQFATLTDYSGPLPAYWNGSTVQAIPMQPSSSHAWNWSTKQWAYDLTEGRAQSWSRIKSARKSAEFGPFVWGGHVFDGDEVSRSRFGVALEGAKEAISAGNTTWSKPWKLANNAVIMLSAPDLVEVVRAHGENMEAAHATAGVLSYFIDAATTPEELEAIQWPV
jgi:hypothetical protein